MFKDTDEELARLASELLKAEEEEIEEYDEEDYEEYEDATYDEEEVYDEDYEEYTSEEELPAYAYEDTRVRQDPVVYQNYSNGYQAYNSDDCDEDLDAFSEDVYDAEDERSNTGLIVTACVLASILAGVMLFVVLKYKGVL
jgi:hypothetical protein